MRKQNQHPEIARHEWDFWPLRNQSAPVLRFIFTYELDRELGSGKAAFLSLPANTRKLAAAKIRAIDADRRQPVRELSFGEMVKHLGADAENWNYLLRGHRTDSTAHLLSIDWLNFTKGEIIEAVTHWIESKPNYILAEGRGLPKNEGGRPEGWFSKLVDLAVWRLSVAKITHRDGIKMLGTSFLPLKGFPNPAGLTAPHWSDCKKRTRAAIDQRLYDLKTLAINLAQVAGESADYRHHFLDLPKN